MLFCIGLPKTGTSSIARALDILGYRCLHDSERASKAFAEAVLNGRPLLSDLSGYDAFSDYPFDVNFPILDRQYPGSKFILTILRARKPTALAVG